MLQLIAHDCDAMPGASGAPLLRHVGERYELVGINTGPFSSRSVRGAEYRPGTANAAVEPARFLAALNKVKHCIDHSTPIASAR